MASKRANEIIFFLQIKVSEKHHNIVILY